MPVQTETLGGRLPLLNPLALSIAQNEKVKDLQSSKRFYTAALAPLGSQWSTSGGAYA